MSDCSSNRRDKNYGIYRFEQVASWFDGKKGKPKHARVPWYQHSQILVPINLHDSFHWIAAVIDLQHKVITCYDSLLVSVVVVIDLA